MEKHSNNLDSLSADKGAKTLQFSKEVSSVFIDNAPAAIAMFDRDMRYLAVSKRWESDYHLDKRDIVGHSHYEIFPDIPESWKDIHSRGIAGEIIREDEDRFERLDGTVQWLRWEIQPWQRFDGVIGGIIIFTEDVTRYKSVEEEVLRLNSVLERRVEERTAELIVEIEVRKLSQQHLSQYEAIIQSSDDAIISKSLEGFIISWNGGAERMFGYSADECVGRSINILIPAEYRQEELSLMMSLRNGETIDHYETVRVCKNGKLIDISVTVSPIRDPLGNILGFSKVAHDITKRKQALELTRKNEERFRLILENSPVAVRIASKATGKVLYANQNYAKLIGLPLEQSIGINPQQFYTDQCEYSEILGQLAKGKDVINKMLKLDNQKEVKWALSSFMLTEFENEPAYLAWIYDISERKQLEAQSEFLAFHDTLTQLPNRRMLNDRLQQAMSANKRAGKYGAVMFIDLDKFKLLNDTYGHGVGDMLLLEVGRRIKASVREMDTVARFGGDEFVVMLAELDKDKDVSKSQAGIVGEKIRAALSEPYVLPITHDGQADTKVEYPCTSSIGVAVFIDNESSQEEVMKHADAAMYEAKKAGRNQIRFYGEKS